jgi:hypothetical protein
MLFLQLVCRALELGLCRATVCAQSDDCGSQKVGKHVVAIDEPDLCTSKPTDHDRDLGAETIIELAIDHPGWVEASESSRIRRHLEGVSPTMRRNERVKCC